MAESAGVAVGLVALAGLFNDAVDCFEYVQIGRAFGKDFQTALLKLDVARLRLSRWGQSVGLGPALDEVQSLGSTALSATDIPLAERTLGHILNLFEDGERVSKRLERTSSFSSAQEGRADHDSTAELSPAHASLHHKMRDLSVRRHGNAGLREKTKWALHGAKEFSRLIEDVRDLVNDLVGIQPVAAARQRQLCEAELSELGRDTDLGLLRAAAADQDKLLSEAISKALKQSPCSTSYSVTFSGNNNSGLQVGVSTGNISFGPSGGS